MIQKTQEGSEVLEHLFSQTALTSTLTPNMLFRAVKGYEAGLGSLKNFFDFEHKNQQKACASNVKDATHGEIAMTEVMVQVRNNYKALGKVRRAMFRVYKRIAQERQLYLTLKRRVNNLVKRWGGYWGVEQKAWAALARVFQAVRTMLSNINNKKAAFVELPAHMAQSFLEMEGVISGIDGEMNGMKILAQTAIEASKNHLNLNNEAVREKMKLLVGRSAEYCQDIENRLIEENEHQKAIFTAAAQLLGVAASRLTVIFNGLRKSAQATNGKMRYMRTMLGAARRNWQSSVRVQNAILNECHHNHHFHSARIAAVNRAADVVSQIKVVIQDRFPAIKTFFLEKLENLSN